MLSADCLFSAAFRAEADSRAKARASGAGKSKAIQNRKRFGSEATKS